jgi:peroxiredoxin
MTTQLPEPLDDGLAAHLVGAQLPDVVLPSTTGHDIRIANYATGRWVLFIYPRTGVPGENEPDGWASIPGAKGCTAEACGFRDNLSELQRAGAEVVAGLSVQNTAHQREAADRLHLPYPLLSDEAQQLTIGLNLPTFEASGMKLLKRMTLILDARTITHVFYPVFPSEGHAEEVRDWLRINPLV